MPTARETYLKFIKAAAEGKLGDALDCVAQDFRGTPSDAPQDKELNLTEYKTEMERLRAAFDHFGRTSDLRIVEKGGVLTATYTANMVFARNLKPRKGSRAKEAMKANGRPVIIEVTDKVTFNDKGEIVTLVSSTDQAKMIAQMTA